MTQPYPIQLSLTGRACLMVGGGRVAARKVSRLISCGAQVTVVSPDIDAELAELAAAGRVNWVARRYATGDMDGVFLVFGTTDSREVNARVAEDAQRRGILCNIADDPDASDFTLPALVLKGDVVLTVSTGGNSPALSRRIRQELEQWLGDEYAVAARILGVLRERLLARGHDPDGHRRTFARILQGGLLSMLRANDRSGVSKLLRRETGMDVMDSDDPALVEGRVRQ